ncbi:hypothetical protein KKF81_05145 [Candidatus Micrarchaeota archaeon]|nr:hypothetical protein [Candidatus Micrarchaeota archaeon]MBU1166313.1 hypothetical protein [Candidatus Micrarchaeota archaeon]MBU1886094.1 hypothetical protein [Candidatus Micrarchaeota archaeon]
MNVKLICLLFAFVLVFGCTSFFDANECYDYHGHKSMTSSPNERYIITQHGYSDLKLVACVFDEELNLVKNITAYRNFVWINDTTFVIDMNGSENCMNSPYCLWIQDINKSVPDRIIPLPIDEEPKEIRIRQSYDRKYLLTNVAYESTITYYQPGSKRRIPIWGEREYDWYATVIDIENALVLNTMNETTFVKEIKQINCSETDLDHCNSYIFSLDEYGIYGYGNPARSHDGKRIATYTVGTYTPRGNVYDYQIDYITIYSLEESFYSRADRITIYSLDEYGQKPVLVEIKNITNAILKNSYYSVDRIEFSQDDRYIAMSGTYSISDGPNIGQISGLGFVIVVDTETEKIVFRDDGGSLSGANYAHFAWSQDGKLLYLFDGETIREIHEIDPENPVKEKSWWSVLSYLR